MGAWGEGVFENDAGGDWIDRLATDGNAKLIDDALAAAVKAKRGRLEADESAEALAAAEVVAAARGHRVAGFPEEAKEWLTTSGYEPSSATAQAATRAVERVASESELAELWAEGDQSAAWNRGLANLLKRLAQPAKPRQKKKPAIVAQKPPKASPRSAIAALKKKKVYVVQNAYHNWCMGRGSSKGPNLEDADLVHFAQLTTLRELMLSRYRLSDAGVLQLRVLTNLVKLELKEMRLGDNAAEVFAGLTHLANLDLQQTRFGDRAAEVVSALPELTNLGMNKTAITDAGLGHLASSPSLNWLGLDGTSVTDAGLKSLAKLKLVRLFLGGTAVTSAGLKNLKSQPELNSLGLERTAIDDEACATIARFTKLTGLWIGHTGVTAAGIRKLTKLPLDYFSFSGLPLTDGDVPLLLAFPGNPNMFLDGTNITPAGLQELNDAGRTAVYGIAD